MKKYAVAIAALLLVAMMLSLVSCTDDFNFIDKSGDDTTTEAGEGTPPTGDQNNGGNGGGIQSGNGGNGGNGGDLGDDGDDPFSKDGWGSPIPY